MHGILFLIGLIILMFVLFMTAFSRLFAGDAFAWLPYGLRVRWTTRRASKKLGKTYSMMCRHLDQLIRDEIKSVIKKAKDT